ncbi:MAG: protein kinase domain-containing protein [Burkholderiales bacterium]
MSAAASQPKTVGRFQVINLLGKGGHGAVYFAHDPQLQRPVALKTVRLEKQSPEAIKALNEEARTISQLQHPNIVTLYDLVQEGGLQYMVLEYVEGQTLAQKIAGVMLDKREALDITRQILDGLAYAHAKNILHCDIKPANIMIDKSGVARIMDFGIAQQKGSASGSKGTPNYMAPEAVAGKSLGEGADVFATGLVLYEMLTGQVAASGENVFAIMNSIANEEFAAPSSMNADVDEKLDGIVLRALLKDPDDRFTSADSFRTALKVYMQPHAEADGDDDSPSAKGTVEFLLRRIRHKSDFPALSQAISAINKITNADAESLHVLSSSILKDFSLTNKLLRLVNSATYGQFGGTISTISRAVIILGFETIRNLAITLILFEHLQNKSQAVHLRDEIILAFFGGLTARMVDQKLGGKVLEESFICAIFHRLGRLLATFYFYDEAIEIKKRVQAGSTEEVAAIAVLGISYDELGIQIARAWNFPDKIVQSMQFVRDEKVRKPQTGNERLRLVTSLSSELTQLAAGGSGADRGQKLSVLAHRYGSALPLNESELTRLVDEAIREFAKEASVYGVNASRSEVLRNARQWAGMDTSNASATPDTLDREFEQTRVMEAQAASPIDPLDRKTVLSAGIQDITNTLVDNYNLNDLLRIILETMFRGMGFDRVLLCTRDMRSNSMPARIGFGPGVDKLLKTFAVPLGKSQDVFQVAIDKQADIFLSDINAPNICDRIPAWYRTLISAQTFILLPLAIDKKVIGMFYADKAEAGSLMIPAQELNLLKTLRNQAVLAIRQKQIG